MGVAIPVGFGAVVAIATITIAELIAAKAGWRSGILRHLFTGLLATIAIYVLVPLLAPPVMEHFALMETKKELLESRNAWNRMNGYALEEASLLGKEVIDAVAGRSRSGDPKSGPKVEPVPLLTDDEILERASFFQTILEKSTDEVCASFLRGNTTKEVLREGFSHLDEESLRRFAQLVVVARTRELANARARETSEEERDRAVNAFLRLIPRDQRKLAARTLEWGRKEGVSDADLCAMGKRLYAVTREIDRHSGALLALALSGF